MPQLLLLALLLAAGQGWAQNVLQPLQAQAAGQQSVEGSLDWTTGVLTVYGEGVVSPDIQNPAQRRLMGFRAAKAVAYRNLLELVGQVHIDATTTVGEAMVASDSIRTRVSGLVRGARLVPESQQEKDGVYQVALTLDLTENLAATLLPAVRRPVPAATPTPTYTPPRTYTGLIIDARGLPLKPSMAPRLLSAGGNELFSANGVDLAYVRRWGVVGYDRDLERASHSDRLGGAAAQPLIIKAAETSGQYGADVVISNEDAVRVQMADQHAPFLAQCRVVFVLGPAPAR
ncbi:MAG: LPP20 family lipoprotein [Candidatus Latescibacteria bacterium]|nr:LPP20 family lipoprotein [Candidatus Latescibacterota bacterium]